MKYKVNKWDLKDILNSPKDVEIIIKKIKRLVTKVSSQRKSLNKNISEKKFFEIIKNLEKIRSLTAILSQYAGLWFSADTKSQQAQALEAKIDDELTPEFNKLIFFNLWWKDLDNKNAERLMKNVGEDKYYLEDIRKHKKYSLSEPEEKIINIKDSTGTSSLVTMYEMLKTGFKFKFKGKELTESEITKYVKSKNAKDREGAYKVVLNKYKSYNNEFGYIFQNVVREHRNEAILLRGYKSPISVRNIANDLPDEVIETLFKVCKKNVKVFQRYFKLKAKVLEMKQMSRFHIYAPVGSKDKKIEFDKAVKMVLSVYKDFSPEMHDLIIQVFNKNHLDSELRKNKLGGAFCASITPKHVPYVLVNYTGEMRDVATLAHELGHAVHSMLASKHSILLYHSVLPLAETASVFGEMLLSEYLYEHETNKNIKLNLLGSKLDDIYATVSRQSYFSLFEKDVHDAVAKGATPNQICKLYHNNLKEQFGPSVNVPEEFSYEWLYVWHLFAAPFYCYAYAFGNLLVLALYQMYQREGESFVPKYLKMLSHGGSIAPEDIVKELGFDLKSEKFWQNGFDYINKLVDEYEELIK